MKSTRILVIAALLMGVGICRADSAAGNDLAKENAELKQRVDKLEKEVEELKTIVMQKAEKPQEARPEPNIIVAPKVKQKPAVPQLSEADMQKILTMVQKEATKKKLVWSDLDIQIYGNLRLDESYDSSQVEPGNYMKWVRRKTTDNKNDSQFDMTANQTRLGLRVNGPDDGQIKTSGQLEIDFYGGGEENKANPRMRHAYMKIEWPTERFEILAGQTWDVISPLNPYTLNDTVLWYTGNIGYRRPQLRLTKTYALSKDVDLKLEGALARTIGRKDSTAFTIDSGSSAGYPGVQGRTSLTFPFFGPAPTTIGVSGHWAREKYDSSTSPSVHPRRKFESWSVNLDLTQPIYKWLTLKGEMFTGSNLDAYTGGIGQGVRNTSTAAAPVYDKEIASKGGWAAFELGPWDKWRFNIGAGIDSPDADDLAGSGSALDVRTQNHAVFGNVIYSINKNAEVGFELSHWRTEYKGTGDADAVRAQTSFMYKF